MISFAAVALHTDTKSFSCFFKGHLVCKMLVSILGYCTDWMILVIYTKFGLVGILIFDIQSNLILLLISGVNMPDHDLIFSQLSKDLSTITPYIAVLQSKDCSCKLVMIHSQLSTI